MKRVDYLRKALVLIMAIIGLTVSAQMTESEIQEMYMVYLDNELDLDPWIDSDGDVQFEYNNHAYFLEVNEDDQQFFRIVMFNIWPIESETERVEVLYACDAVNRELKVVKAHLINDNAWLACEMYLPAPSDFESVMERSLNSIEDAVNTFVENM